MNTQLKKGTLELCVLCLLEKRDYYGYELVASIPKEVNMSEGTVYPLLKRLQGDGLLTTYWAESLEGPPRKYYRISEDGRKAYLELRDQWMVFSKAVETMLTKEASL